jgi:urea transport system substrate-binding protein
MADRRPIRVGVLFSTTGVARATEASMLKATLHAIAEVNEQGGVDGRKLVAVHYDPGSQAGNFNILADRLLVEDGVRIIFGCYMSSERKAVLPVVERRNGLLFYPAQYEGFEYSRNVIHTGAVPNQNSIPLGHYLLQHVGRSFFMVGSDYIWPWESDRIMSDMIRGQEGQIVGERYLKLDASEFEHAALVREIKQVKPDGIFCNFVGDSIVHFYQAFAAAGLNPKTMPIASLTTSEADIEAMGIEASVGHITAATYFEAIDSDINRSMLTRYRARYGAAERTHMCWESAYFQVHLAANAMRLAGSDDIHRIRPALNALDFNAPQGRVQIDPENGHTYLWSRIGRVDGAGQFEVLFESSRAIKPDPYLVSFDPTDWSLKSTITSLDGGLKAGKDTPAEIDS